MQRDDQLLTESGINTKAALKFYNWAEELAQKKAADKADIKMIKNLDSINELQVMLEPFLYPAENIGYYRIDDIKILLENLLSNSSEECKKYYPPADLINDVETFLKNNEACKPYYSADIADVLKQELLIKGDKIFSPEDIMKKLNSLLSSQNTARYEAVDIAKALNQLLMQKQQVSYGAEEIAVELKELLDPIVMGVSDKIVEDYSKFHNLVYDWDCSHLPGSEQIKCGAVQQVLLSLLGNIKENYHDFLIDQYFVKIKTDIDQALSDKANLGNTSKDKQTFEVLKHKIIVMNLMISWLNNEIKLNVLQELAGDNYHYCDKSSIDTNKLLNEVISFHASPEELNYFKQTQPLINEICQSISVLAKSEQTEINMAKMNILLAMKYHLTSKPFLVNDKGYPEVNDALSMNESATVDQAIAKNPAYHVQHRITGIFKKANEIDTLKKKIDSIKISSELRSGLKFG